MQLITLDDKIRASIKKNNLFFYLTEQELHYLLEVSDIVHYDKKESIVNQGDDGHDFFGMIDGTANVIVLEKGNENDVIVSTIKKGETFGEASVFLTEKRMASVVCEKTCRVVRTHREQMLHYMKEHPTGGNKILMMIIHSLLNKLKKANQEIALEKQSEINMEEIDSLVRAMM